MDQLVIKLGAFGKNGGEFRKGPLHPEHNNRIQYFK